MEIFNTRTKQNMPIKYQFFEDLDSNYKRLSIKDNFKNNINTLIIHGEEDKSIPVEEALDFAKLPHNMKTTFSVLFEIYFIKLFVNSTHNF